MTSASLEPVSRRPASLTEIAFDRIRAAILDKSLEPGTRVSESALSEMLQVSKTPVREALLRLYHIGLVESTSTGLRVVRPDADLVRDVFELRSTLEVAAARQASERATGAQRRGIVDAADESSEHAERGDRAAFSEANLIFHNRIAEASGNRLFVKSIGDTLLLAVTLRSRDAVTSDHSLLRSREHQAIARAILDGDADLAGTLVAAHVSSLGAAAEGVDRAPQQPG